MIFALKIFLAQAGVSVTVTATVIANAAGHALAPRDANILGDSYKLFYAPSNYIIHIIFYDRMLLGVLDVLICLFLSLKFNKLN